MEKLSKLEMMARDLIKYYCPEYTFVWDRSIRRKGQIRYGVKQIGISKPLAELNTIECMLLTVIHEIAHALNKMDGHGNNWKKTCVDLGGNGERCYNSNEINMPPKWVLYQNGIKTHFTRYRRFKVQLGSGLEWRKE
jgi:hypothetical protein